MGFSTERSAHNKVRRKKDKTEQKVKVRLFLCQNAPYNYIIYIIPY